MTPMSGDAPSPNSVPDGLEGARLAAARTLGEALQLATAWLRAAGSETPALDAQTLLAHVTSAPRVTLLAYPERALAPDQAAAYAGLVARRAAQEPVAYLTGRREFMGLEFHTDRRALIPRPETELLVEAALREIRQRLSDPARPAPIAADIGTGSGAIAVALAALDASSHWRATCWSRCRSRWISSSPTCPTSRRMTRASRHRCAATSRN